MNREWNALVRREAARARRIRQGTWHGPPEPAPWLWVWPHPPRHLAPHEHHWEDCEVYCEDCGSHAGVECATCDTVIDLVREDDPRE